MLTFGVLHPGAAPVVSSGWLPPHGPGIVRFVLGAYDAVPAIAMPAIAASGTIGSPTVSSMLAILVCRWWLFGAPTSAVSLSNVYQAAKAFSALQVAAALQVLPAPIPYQLPAHFANTCNHPEAILARQPTVQCNDDGTAVRRGSVQQQLCIVHGVKPPKPS